MRTTVDLPDDLYRRAKSQAALQGRRLRDLVEEGLRRVLDVPMPGGGPVEVDFPLHRSRRPGTLTVTDVNRAHDEAALDEDEGRGATG